MLVCGFSGSVHIHRTSLVIKTAFFHEEHEDMRSHLFDPGIFEGEQLTRFINASYTRYINADFLWVLKRAGEGVGRVWDCSLQQELTSLTFILPYPFAFY